MPPTSPSRSVVLEPALLEELETEAVLVRHRSASPLRRTRLRLEVATAQPRASPCADLEAAPRV